MAPPGVRVIVAHGRDVTGAAAAASALVDVAGIPQADALTDRLLSARRSAPYYTERARSRTIIWRPCARSNMLESETAQSAGPWRASVVCAGIASDRIAVAGLGSTFALVSADGGAVSMHPPGGWLSTWRASR